MPKQKRIHEYKVNDIPPGGHLIVLSFQHVMLMFVCISFPIIFASQVNASAEFTKNLIAYSIIACGVGSIIQSVGLPFIGSKYLCPNIVGPSYYSVSLSAIWVGGLPLVKGMIIIAGLVEIILAPIVEKLKRVFPTHIIGLVVALVGVSTIRTSIVSFFGVAYKGDAIRLEDLMVGTFALFVMVFANIWGQGIIKIYCLLVGIISGWLFALIIIPEYWHNLKIAGEHPFFDLPTISSDFWKYSFDLKLLIPFFIIGVSGSLKSFGNLLIAQKISEPELTTQDYKPIKKGLLSDGISTVFAGLIGGMAVDTCSSSIGLAGSTKVVSRWLSVAAGTIFMILAFFPKFIIIVAQIPRPVLGSSLVFAGSFMLTAGLKEMFSEGWDPKKTFAVGISLIFGLSTSMVPEIYARTPEIMQSFFTDPLPTSTIIAVILNQIFDLDRFFNKNL